MKCYDAIKFGLPEMHEHVIKSRNLKLSKKLYHSTFKMFRGIPAEYIDGKSFCFCSSILSSKLCTNRRALFEIVCSRSGTLKSSRPDCILGYDGLGRAGKISHSNSQRDAQVIFARVGQHSIVQR